MNSRSTMDTMQFSLTGFPRHVHKVAKVRAVQKGLTLKAYIEQLILQDAGVSDPPRAPEPAAPAGESS